jgi:hypothetical protein
LGYGPSTTKATWHLWNEILVGFDLNTPSLTSKKTSCIARILLPISKLLGLKQHTESQAEPSLRGPK